MASKQDPRFFIEITRVDEEERMVYGYGTREDIKDSHGTIIDLESVVRCMDEYMKFPAVREMHQPSAAGKTVEYTVDDIGVQIGAKVVDDQAWKKVKERVYRGFSIGGKKEKQIGDRLYLKSIAEFSLVDRPSNSGCTIDEFRMYSEEAEPMKTEEKKAEVKRGMYDVGRFGELLQSLAYVASNAQDESNWEGDKSPVPAKLRAALLPLVEVYKEMAQEEIDELMAGLAKSAGAIVALSAEPDTTRADAKNSDGDGDEGSKGKKKPDNDGDEEQEMEEVSKADAPDITRAGKRNSSKDAADLQTIHDACCRLGALCGDSVSKADSPDVTRLAQLEEDVTRLQGENDTLRAQVKKLEDEPAPAKGVTRVVGKEDDTEGIQPEEKRMEEVTDPQEAIKRIHQAGGTRITRV